MTSRQQPLDVIIEVEQLLPQYDEEELWRNRLSQDGHTLDKEKVYSVKTEPQENDGDDTASVKTVPQDNEGDDKKPTVIEVSLDPLSIFPENPFEFHDHQQDTISRTKSNRKLKKASRIKEQQPDQQIAYDQPSFACPSCLMLLGSKKALKAHMYTHEEKPHPCTMCDKRILKDADEKDIMTDQQKRKREMATERMRRFRQRKQLALAAKLGPVTEEMRRERIREFEEKREQERERARERSRKYRENKKLENELKTLDQ